VTQGTSATTSGGAITIDSVGKFTYTPPLGASSGTDTYDYTGTAHGVARTATITFTITDIVWYVDNASAAAPDGSSQSPFLDLGADLAAVAQTDAYISVANGASPTSGAYTLLTGQHLVGGGATLTSGAGSGHTLNLPGFGGSDVGAVATFVNGNNVTFGTASYAVYTDPPPDVAAFTGLGTTCSTP